MRPIALAAVATCAAALLIAFAAPPAQADSQSFWKSWSDGRAELNGYTLVQPRYGELRQGHAVLVFVTEPFSRSKGVKVDRYVQGDPDQFTALKLNHVRKFQTGLYDYSVMTSVFADPAHGLRPVKVSFSMQEWCGHVYEQATVGADGIAVRTDSYFEGETTTARLPTDLLIEDGVFIQARGLMVGGPGQVLSGEARMLGSATTRRLKHLGAQPVTTTFTWSAPRAVTVPAGTFEVRGLSYQRQDRRTCAIDVEVAAPHRIIGWSCDDGEKAQLTGTMRSPYWQQAREGDERLLSKLGLAPIQSKR